MLDLFKKLIQLDIIDINFDVSSKNINQVKKLNSGKYDLVEGLFRLFYHILTSIFFLKFNLKSFDSKVLLFSGTKNQTLALDKLSNRLDVGMIKFGNQSNHFNNSSFEAFVNITSILFFPFFIVRYYKVKDKFHRKMMRCRLDRFLISYSLFLFYYFMLKEKNKVVVVSNDHSVWQRTLIEVCEIKKIKTVYIQHANVSKSFPDLKFDYSFLDGTYAQSCYRVAKGKVYLVGCLRFEGLRRLAGLTKKTLICFNKIDTEISIRKVITFFLSHKLEFGVRLHPAESRSSVINYIENTDGVNNVSGTSLEDAFNSHYYCFSGTSSVFLDASIFGLKCFSIREMFDDYYKFEKNKLVIVFDNLVCINLNHLESLNQNSVELYNFVQKNLRGYPTPSERIAYILKRDNLI